MHSIKLAMHLRADGTFRPVMPKNGVDFTLAELQEYVGGMFQIVEAKDGEMILIINEEGKLTDPQIVNERATSLYKYDDHDIIVGDALYCARELVR